MLTANQYYEYLRSLFSDQANAEIAEKQVRYMKNHFEFFGMKAPTWLPILKTTFKELGILEGEELRDFVMTCFEDDCREMQYAAIEMVQKGIKKQPEEFYTYIRIYDCN